jgi:exosome complex RNA-binding protein Rrp42 (RNase PH superfamily)
MTAVDLSSSEKNYIASGIAADLRGDGRGRYHFRPFSIDTGIIPQVSAGALKFSLLFAVCSLERALLFLRR